MAGEGLQALGQAFSPQNLTSAIGAFQSLQDLPIKRELQQLQLDAARSRQAAAKQEEEKLKRKQENFQASLQRIQGFKGSNPYFNDLSAGVDMSDPASVYELEENLNSSQALTQAMAQWESLGIEMGVPMTEGDRQALNVYIKAKEVGKAADLAAKNLAELNPGDVAAEQARIVEKQEILARYSEPRVKRVVSDLVTLRDKNYIDQQTFDGLIGQLELGGVGDVSDEVDALSEQLEMETEEAEKNATLVNSINALMPQLTERDQVSLKALIGQKDFKNAEVLYQTALQRAPASVGGRGGGFDKQATQAMGFILQDTPIKQWKDFRPEALAKNVDFLEAQRIARDGRAQLSESEIVERLALDGFISDILNMDGTKELIKDKKDSELYLIVEGELAKRYGDYDVQREEYVLPSEYTPHKIRATVKRIQKGQKERNQLNSIKKEKHQDSLDHLVSVGTFRNKYNGRTLMRPTSTGFTLTDPLNSDAVSAPHTPGLSTPSKTQINLDNYGNVLHTSNGVTRKVTPTGRVRYIGTTSSEVGNQIGARLRKAVTSAKMASFEFGDAAAEVAEGIAQDLEGIIDYIDDLVGSNKINPTNKGFLIRWKQKAMEKAATLSDSILGITVEADPETFSFRDMKLGVMMYDDIRAVIDQALVTPLDEEYEAESALNYAKSLRRLQ